MAFSQFQVNSWHYLPLGTDMKLREIILDAIELKGKHSGKNIAKYVLKTLKELKAVIDKLLYFIFYFFLQKIIFLYLVSFRY